MLSSQSGENGVCIMQDVIIPVEVLEAAIKASREYSRPVEATWDGLRILSEPRPTMKNGKRLVLSDGPATHQAYLWTAYYTETRGEAVWHYGQCFPGE